MSGTEEILMACHRLEQAPGRGREATIGEIVVRVWLLNKNLFGLRGFEDLYPDSNKVSYRMAGANGLVARGWVERTGDNGFRLTETGRRLARLIDERLSP